MKTTLRTALIFALLATSQLGLAAGKTTSASFQATFVVNEACAVQSSNAKPVVSCQFNAPYQVTAPAATTSANAAAEPGATRTAATDLITITF